MSISDSSYLASIDAVEEGLRRVDYLPSREIATTVFLANRLAKPILVEGPAGTGKTELAKAISRLLSRELVRLQCYEGLDDAKAIYEWNYSKQLLRIQSAKNSDDETSWSGVRGDIFTAEFLLERPLLHAISGDEPKVLLVDEVDRVEVETEALFLEVLSDFQVTIPEFGTIKASSMPLVLLTSNNTRELSEALKRRCLFLHLGYPSRDRSGSAPNISARCMTCCSRPARRMASARSEGARLTPCASRRAMAIGRASSGPSMVRMRPVLAASSTSARTSSSGGLPPSPSASTAASAT